MEALQQAAAAAAAAAATSNSTPVPGPSSGGGDGGDGNNASSDAHVRHARPSLDVALLQAELQVGGCALHALGRLRALGSCAVGQFAMVAA